MTIQQDSYSSRASRREALRLLGLGAGFGIVSSLGGGAELLAAAFQKAAGGVTLPVFPRGAVIRTVLKDVPPEALGNGAILVHEHLSMMNFRQKPPREWRFLEDNDYILEEVRAAGKEGVSCIVDCAFPEMGRNLGHLKRIARLSGVHVVGSGGHYAQVSYPAEIARMSEDQIAEQVVEEVTSERLGAFCEIGSSEATTPDERKVHRAIGKAHLRTGLAIITHTDNANGAEKTALEKLDLFESVGVKPDRVVIGHLDGFDDPQLHAAVARRGAYVGFDRVGSGGTDRDAIRVRNIVKFLEAGYANKLILSSDFAQEKMTKRAGGPGYALTVTQFVPKLRQAGVKEEILHSVMVDNPRRLLAFVPKKGS